MAPPPPVGAVQLVEICPSSERVEAAGCVGFCAPLDGVGVLEAGVDVILLPRPLPFRDALQPAAVLRRPNADPAVRRGAAFAHLPLARPRRPATNTRRGWACLRRHGYLDDGRGAAGGVRRKACVAGGHSWSASHCRLTRVGGVAFAPRVVDCAQPRCAAPPSSCPCHPSLGAAAARVPAAASILGCPGPPSDGGRGAVLGGDAARHWDVLPPCLLQLARDCTPIEGEHGGEITNRAAVVLVRDDRRWEPDGTRQASPCLWPARGPMQSVYRLRRSGLIR